MSPEWTSDLLACLQPCLLFFLHFWLHVFLLLTGIPEGIMDLMNHPILVEPCYDPPCSDVGGLHSRWGEQYPYLHCSHPLLLLFLPCGAVLLWLFLDGTSEQQTCLHSWRQWTPLTKLAVLLEINFLPFQYSPQKVWYIFEYLLYFNLDLGRAWVRTTESGKKLGVLSCAGARRKTQESPGTFC